MSSCSSGGPLYPGQTRTVTVDDHNPAHDAIRDLACSQCGRRIGDVVDALPYGRGQDRASIAVDGPKDEKRVVSALCPECNFSAGDSSEDGLPGRPATAAEIARGDDR